MTNPYAAPKAAVADETLINKGDFIPEGRPVPAGNGWTWIGDAWALFAKQWGLWIGMFVVLLVIFIGLSLVPFIGSLIAVLLWPVFLGGMLVGCRVLDEDGEMEFNHLFAGFRERAGVLVGVGALTMLATLIVGVVVALVMGAGFAGAMFGGGDVTVFGTAMLLGFLVFIALLVPVMMASWFAPALVVFHDMGAMDSLKASFFGCLKNVLPFLVYGLILFIPAIVATLPIGLGWLVLGPVVTASVYTGYRDIYFKRP